MNLTLFGDSPAHAVPPSEALLSLLHEMQVHQIELELQNEELLRDQERLQASRTRYVDLYQLAPVGYCTLSEEGRVLEANLAVIRMLGLSRGEILNRPVITFLPPADQGLYQQFRRKFQEGPGRYSCALRMVRGDGSDFPVQITAMEGPGSALESAEEGAARPFSRLIICDITDLRQREEDSFAQATRLRNARERDAPGVLAVEISDVFKTPLAAIQGCARTGGMVADRNPELLHLFSSIETSALKGMELLQQLLAYVGKARWAMEEVDLDIIAREICRSLSFSLPWNLTLTRDLADRVPYWRGDSIQAFQMAMNLVLNSYEAFPEGVPGVISLRTEGVRLDATRSGMGTWVLPTAPGRYVMLEVEDSGRGMTPEVMSQAFEPFFTTKASGRGMGLAAVQGILGGHGGGLWVRSRPGNGTTVRIFLPAMTEARGA